MAKYLCVGGLCMNTVYLKPDAAPITALGGGGLFALSGIKLWSDSCKLVCNAGTDYRKDYGAWLKENGLPCDAIHVLLDRTGKTILTHNPDGSYFQEYVQGNVAGLMEHGYLEMKPEEVLSDCDEDSAAFYMAQQTDRVKWRAIDRLKEKSGMKMMWELHPHNVSLESVREVIRIADMWSLNWEEAEQLFGIPREKEEDMLGELMKLPVEMIFYREGKKGAYVITGNSACFCDAVEPFGASVDPTGCGNSSTGAAMVAYMEGRDAKMTGIMANIAAGYTAAQFGPYPCVTKEERRRAWQMAQRLYREDVS